MTYDGHGACVGPVQVFAVGVDRGCSQGEADRLRGVEDRAQRRAHFEANKAASRAQQRKERRFRELEELIDQAEKDLARIQRAMMEAGDDWEKLAKWTAQQQKIETDLAYFMKEWSELGDELTS